MEYNQIYKGVKVRADFIKGLHKERIICEGTVVDILRENEALFGLCIGVKTDKTIYYCKPEELIDISTYKKTIYLNLLPSSAKEKALEITEQEGGITDDLEVLKEVVIICKEKGFELSVTRSGVTPRLNISLTTIEDSLETGVDPRPLK